jgi:hypothetical protein
MAASATWSIQPEIEKSLTNKLCANCSQPASRVCSKCRCTIYCGEDCQRKHWRSGHKAHCVPDPLFFITRVLSQQKYRDFSAEEKEEHLAYTLLPGCCKGQQSEDRDKFSSMIRITNTQFLEFLQNTYNGIEVGRNYMSQMFSIMGWGSMDMGIQPVDGFSAEDSIIFRMFFDDNFQNKPQIEENLIANILMNSGNTRGKFVVVKNRVDPRDNSDTMIPFSKAELVDMMTWRVFCGHHQMVSSRVFRENMRRREMQDVIASKGFEILTMGQN